MDRTADKKDKGEVQAERNTKKAYVQPEVLKKEKLALISGVTEGSGILI